MAPNSRTLTPIIRAAQSSVRQCTATATRTVTTHCSSRSTSIASRCQPITQQCRQFSQTPRSLAYKSVEEAKSRGNLGVKLPIPFSQVLLRGLLFLGTGAIIIFYFREERSRLDRKKLQEQSKGIGKPKVGGPFNLVDQDGKPFSDRDMRGKYPLVYFGFTHCPDICPDELDKMSEMIEAVKKQVGENVLLPVMITCDPARDTPDVLKPYLAEFHPEILGLTGTYQDIKATCKAYRVYFSTPPELKPGQDYLVDHSIYFYLMDPDGDFVEALGRNFTAEQAAQIMIKHIKDWDGPLDRSPKKPLPENATA